MAILIIDRIFSDELIKEFGPSRSKSDELTQDHKDLAASIQRITEELIFHIAEGLYKRTSNKKLCIAGGVAQNSVANGKILSNTSFEELYIPSAGHDAGTAMGAGLYLYNHVLGNARGDAIYNAYTGSHYSTSEIENFLRSKEIEFTTYNDQELLEAVSDKLIDGAVVGWFQGRAEFGPRALGHRSILVDPRRKDAKQLLNDKIKRRESFRPFAPSILEEHVKEYFEINDRVPFMEKVYPIKEAKHNIIPAVTHVDGTGRLQTVMKGDRYYDLIEAFYKKTDVPVLLNTSFNENEPIVNTPQEAYDCFHRTKMDVLVMENVIISR